MFLFVCLKLFRLLVCLFIFCMCFVCFVVVVFVVFNQTSYPARMTKHAVLLLVTSKKGAKQKKITNNQTNSRKADRDLLKYS